VSGFSCFFDITFAIQIRRFIASSRFFSPTPRSQLSFRSSASFILQRNHVFTRSFFFSPPSRSIVFGFAWADAKRPTCFFLAQASFRQRFPLIFFFFIKLFILVCPLTLGNEVTPETHCFLFYPSLSFQSSPFRYYLFLIFKRLCSTMEP